jgi:DNA invertase Pin-like site-specific DNA recombinase
MKLGYARIIDHESLEKQVNALVEYGCDKIFTDTLSEKTGKKDGLSALLDYARQGDIVVVSKLGRLARSIQELGQITKELKERDIGFITINQFIDTETPNNYTFFDMIEIIAEFERELIIERVKSGIQTAREKGIKLGRKSANVDQKEIAYEMYCSSDYTMKEIVEATGISRATIYRYIELKKASE